jgi:hypothetical protein
MVAGPTEDGMEDVHDGAPEAATVDGFQTGIRQLADVRVRLLQVLHCVLMSCAPNSA